MNDGRLFFCNNVQVQHTSSFRNLAESSKEKSAGATSANLTEHDLCTRGK